MCPWLSHGTQAVILTVSEPIQKEHVPLCCRSAQCDRKGVYHWHNYCVDNRKHLFHGDATAMKCIMLTSRFGVTTEYLEQLHERMLREHVSFVGEADVAARLAARPSTLVAQVTASVSGAGMVLLAVGVTVSDFARRKQASDRLARRCGSNH